jgi:DNA-binding PadR family transcriptional regulator
VLDDAGYVTLTKPTGRGGRVRTWVSLTAAGRRALDAHLAELHRLTAPLPTDATATSERRSRDAKPSPTAQPRPRPRPPLR